MHFFFTIIMYYYYVLCIIILPQYPLQDGSGRIVKLGEWLHSQRRGKQSKTLTAERMGKLQALADQVGIIPPFLRTITTAITVLNIVTSLPCPPSPQPATLIRTLTHPPSFFMAHICYVVPSTYYVGILGIVSMGPIAQRRR
jgi:hypothetical protein